MCCCCWHFRLRVPGQTWLGGSRVAEWLEPWTQVHVMSVWVCHEEAPFLHTSSLEDENKTLFPVVSVICEQSLTLNHCSAINYLSSKFSNRIKKDAWRGANPNQVWQSLCEPRQLTWPCWSSISLSERWENFEQVPTLMSPIFDIWGTRSPSDWIEITSQGTSEVFSFSRKSIAGHLMTPENILEKDRMLGVTLSRNEVT